MRRWLALGVIVAALAGALLWVHHHPPGEQFIGSWEQVDAPENQWRIVNVGNDVYEIHGSRGQKFRAIMDRGQLRVTNGPAMFLTYIADKDMVLTHVNLNDRTCAGMEHKKLPVFSVQYHPEAAPGPHDANHHFDRFVKMMSENQK